MVTIKQICLVSLLTIALLGFGAGGVGATLPADKTLGDDLVVTLNLDKLPGSIKYNRAKSPDGAIEFKWSVTFDINGDEKINQGDVILQILHFKAPGSTEKTGAISDLPASLWVYKTDRQKQNIVAISKLISGNTITLTANKSSYPALGGINASTMVYFETSARDDNTSASINDYYPSLRKYTKIPTDKKFADAQGDVASAAIDMIKMQISF